MFRDLNFNGPNFTSTVWNPMIRPISTWPASCTAVAQKKQSKGSSRQADQKTRGCVETESKRKRMAGSPVNARITALLIRTQLPVLNVSRRCGEKGRRTSRTGVDVGKY